MTYRELYETGCAALKAAGIGEAELDARLLLEFVCHTDRNELLVHGDRKVDSSREKEYLCYLSEREKRVPLQYLTGEQNFMGLTFRVNKHVLIPRQDTEILVEEVLRNLHDGTRILDMCTGSGCILISLLHYSNNCTGLGADISEDALAVARQNAKDLPDVSFVQSNLFENITGEFEVIVSNPPYIPSNVIPTLMPEVRDYEPLLALDGAEDGLFFYREIVDKSRRYLSGGGRLYLEIGFDQANAVSRLMKDAGFLEVTVVQDYAGLDRVVCGQKSAGSLG